MTSPELISYLKRLGFTDNSYTISVEYIHLHYMNMGGDVVDIVIGVCRELDTNVYRQQFGNKPDIFNIKYIQLNKIGEERINMIDHYTIDEVLKFIVDNRIGNTDVLREAVIELKCRSLLT